MSTTPLTGTAAEMQSNSQHGVSLASQLANQQPTGAQQATMQNSTLHPSMQNTIGTIINFPGLSFPPMAVKPHIGVAFHQRKAYQMGRFGPPRHPVFPIQGWGKDNSSTICREGLYKCLSNTK